MADPDIVVRLRQGWLAHWDTDVRFVMVYASEWVRLTNLTTESADEIERLRAERDEARRSVCALFESHLSMLTTGKPYSTPDRERTYARIQGWDCFKESSDER